MSRLSGDIHPSFTDENLKALHSVKIFTVDDFLQAQIKQITSSSNLSYKETLAIKKYITNKNAAVTRDGFSYYKEFLSRSALISTGIQSFDSLLDGGLLTGQIYEVCGLPAAGKTQLCMTIAKNVALLNRNVYYLDTKNDFRGKRLKQMLENTENVSEDQVPLTMRHIFIRRVLSKYDLICSLYDIKKEIMKGICVRLIIIDSLPALFHHTSNYTETNGLLNNLANMLRFLVVECHIVVIVTNILTTWFDGNFKTMPEASLMEKINLGKYWFSVPNTRLIIRNDCDNDILTKTCDITICKYNLNVLERSCVVSVKNCGVC